MDFTGERLVLGKKGIEQLEMEHLHRYNSVLNVVKDKVVLDIACGTGYGSALLAQKAKYVYGIDISKEAINYCNETYIKDNLSYFEGSIDKLELEDNSVDVIISFETIEHVNGKLQEEFLIEIKRVLKNDGILIISTPDKKIYSDIPKYHNEFHIKEFYREEFKEFLSKAFNNVNIFNQGLQICDIICNEKMNVDKRLEVKEQISESLYPYLIAICSNVEITSIDLSSFVIDKDNSLFLLNRKFDDFNNMLSGDNLLINQKNIIEQKENYIEQQRQKIEQLRITVEQKEEYINEQRKELDDRRIIIEQKENYINEQRKELDERRIIIEQKQDYIEEQRRELQEYRKELENHKIIIEQKENYIQEQRNELNEIKNSKYYKIYMKLKKH
ncbi:class I SAM-dependent methyltransferase [Clostridium butyricum]|uniref:class I SAM-dependent methyltransferase n=1 Tax=Clostridium butyricum TaxID=1492 RepID=UPI0006A7F210|nr:class I SAM-dependent methyltransferase [Clostridium butyricum]